jgi:CheY-like chemotaxis protein
MSDPKTVLYAEDDENDVFLMERAFEKLHIANPLKNVTDGKLALAYLAGNPPYTDRQENPLPCLMLLDLSMPGKHGLDVLQWVRTQPKLTGLPVVVLSSSNQESDIHRAYSLGASGFFVKPGDPEELLRIVAAVREHWLDGKGSPDKKLVDLGAFRPRPPEVNGNKKGNS